MTALAADTARFDLDAAPIRIGRVTLRVRNLSRASRFYQDVIGLRPLDETPCRVTLGAGRRPLLVLEGDPALRPLDRREAGLFHTAFLLPSRADLGRWFAHARARGVRLDGASDHEVSEAIYLADPEGNGIEIYADRPPAVWPRQDGTIAMTTKPLDAAGLLAAGAGGTWSKFPEGGVIGHVHLQVGDTVEAERFYRGTLGFEVTCRYPGASFFGPGGYHHQLAANTWNSAGASRRPDDSAGLAAVELLRDAAAQPIAATSSGNLDAAGSLGRIILDPWGTMFVLA
jgi:catechol 2,3-dioxygenase